MAWKLRTKPELRTGKRPNIEGEARDKSGGGIWVEGLVSPSPENVSNKDSEMVQSGAYFTSKLPDKDNSLHAQQRNKNYKDKSKIKEIKEAQKEEKFATCPTERQELILHAQQERQETIYNYIFC